MANKKSRFGDTLSIPEGAEDFVQGAEKRSRAHTKTATDMMVSTSIRMNRKTHKRLKLASINNDTSITELVDRAVNDLLNRLEQHESYSVNNGSTDGL